MLVKKINNGNSFHGQAIRDGYVHIPVVVQTNSVFFEMLRSVKGSFITGHFVQGDEQIRNDPFQFDFLLDVSEILNGNNCTNEITLFYLYILDHVYYKKILLPEEFKIHFILKAAENNCIAETDSNKLRNDGLHSVIIPGVLR